MWVIGGEREGIVVRSRKGFFIHRELKKCVFSRLKSNVLDCDHLSCGVGHIAGVN